MLGCYYPIQAVNPLFGQPTRRPVVHVVAVTVKLDMCRRWCACVCVPICACVYHPFPLVVEQQRENDKLARDAANRWQRRFWPVAVDEVAQPDVGLSAKQALPLFLQITWDQSGQMSGRSCFQRGMVDSCDPPSAARLRLSAAQAPSIGLGGTYHPNHQVQRPGRFFDAEPGGWRLLYSSAPLSPSSHNLSSF